MTLPGDHDPPPGLESVVAKLDRAGEHVDNLYAEITAWGERNPCGIDSEPKGATLKKRIYVVIRERPDLRRRGLIAADAVHNTRASLDHLVYALAVCVSGEDPPPEHDSLAFPIADREDYFPTVKSNRLHGLTVDMVQAIRDIQPYIRGDLATARSDYLAVLRAFDNAGKHRLVVPALLQATRFQSAVQTLGIGEFNVTANARPLEEDPTLFTYESTSVYAYVEPKNEADVRICVRLDGYDAPFDLPNTLSSMFNRTAQVIRGFERFF